MLCISMMKRQVLNVLFLEKKETKPETYLNDLNKLLNLVIFFQLKNFQLKQICELYYTHLDYQYVILFKKMRCALLPPTIR